MEYGIKIEKKYLGIPIRTEHLEEKMEIFCEEEKIFEFMVPVLKGEKEQKYDYYSYLNVERYMGKTLRLQGDFESVFFHDFCQSDTNEQEELVRPLLHFTAERGWINDPNGLVYHDGRYHLYFQHNPMNTQWQNMSWGHSVSSDLLRFEQQDTVLYPDAYGPAYSGCGLVNERGLLGLGKDTLLFFYSAAGGVGEWSRGKWFTQRIAYSTDEGKTFVKLEDAAVGELESDTRDPKIFWHEKSKAYIMVLWIKGNEFGFLRSENLSDWRMTDRIVLDEAWECPDLFPLVCDREEVWVFTSADGFYYFGEFDGYTFQTDKVQHNAYLTKLPYAAQTYSGVQGRVVSVPWMRTRNVGKLYTGMMGLPRELGVQSREGKRYLTMLPVREYLSEREQTEEFAWEESGFDTEICEDVVTEIELTLQETKNIQIHFFKQDIMIRDREIFYKGEKTVLPEALREVHFIIDRGIIEVYGNEGTINAYYETDSDALQGRIHIAGGHGKGKIYNWRR